ncbi:MAG: DUF6498-containing protein [Pirellulales bacterium]
MRALFKYVSRYRSSALALIIANGVPLLGVLFWNWDAFEVVALYWAENVVIGAINVLKMITCAPQPAKIDWEHGFTPEEITALKEAAGLSNRETDGDNELAQIKAAIEKTGKANEKVALPGGIAQLPAVLTFAFLYGWFCLGHGIFVFAMFGRGDVLGMPIESLVRLSGATYKEFFWPVLALAASHSYSFVANYLGRGEYRRVSVGTLIFQPFSRVVLLHVTLIIATWFFVLLGSPLPLLLLLVIGKTALDLLFHLRERARNAVSYANSR